MGGGDGGGARGRALPLLSVVALTSLPLGQVALAAGLVGAVLAVAVVVAGLRRRSWLAVRVAVMALLMALAGSVGLPFALWLAVGVLWLAGRRWAHLRPDDGWVPPGGSSPAAWALLVATVVGAAVALWLWLLSEPRLGESTEQLVDVARQAPTAVVFVSIAVFVLVNPVVEEVAYRLVAFEAARAALSAPAAVVLQAVAFGALHIDGFPAGAVGMALSFVYGLALGVIRLMTGGLRLAIIAHIGTNATIAVLVMTLLVP